MKEEYKKSMDNKRIGLGGIIFTFIQALAISGVYLYARVVKNIIFQGESDFLLILITIIVYGLMGLSILISLVYSIAQLIDTRKIYTILPIMINITAIIIGQNFITNDRIPEKDNFEYYLQQRQEIVELIIEGELEIEETGKVAIPLDLQDEQMASGGYVRLISYRDKMGIYFCTYPGLLETSSGYIFLTEELKDAAETGEYIIVFEDLDLGNGWYPCSTD